MAQRTGLVVVLFVLSSLGGCGAQVARPVPRVPADAELVLEVAEVSGAAELLSFAARAGLAPAALASLAGDRLAAAGLAGPVVVGVRPQGGSVVAVGVLDRARLDVAVAAIAAERGGRALVLGRVEALGDVLVRVDEGAVFVVVGAVDLLAEAALLEALASGSAPAFPLSPQSAPGARLVARAPSGPGVGLAGVVRRALGDVTGTVRVEGDTLVVDLAAPGASAAARAALEVPASPYACALEGGAVVVHVPPLDIDDAKAAIGGALDDMPASLDAFASRLAIGLQPRAAGPPENDLSSIAAITVVGVPKPNAAAALRSSVDEALGTPGLKQITTKTVGEREVRALPMAGRAGRDLSVVVAPDLFALGIGASVTVDRVAALPPPTADGGPCPAAPGALLRISGGALTALIERGRPDLAALRNAVTLVGVDDPLAAVAAIDRLALDATTTPAGVSGRVSVSLRRP